MAFYLGFYAYAIIVHTQADQLLPQLLMEQGPRTVSYSICPNFDSLCLG